MKRTRSYTLPWIYNPFSLYRDCFKTSLQIAEMVNSSTEVIAYRSQMMAEVINGNIPFNHEEFTIMWQEKFAANMEALLAMTKHAEKMTVAPLGERNIELYLRGIKSVLKPYYSKSKANALRLRKK